MTRNKVQFQKGVSLSEFIQEYGTEEQCFDALYRWPQGLFARSATMTSIVN